MCGIVGGVTERDLVPILIEGLRRLEYRGYDSAGVALVTEGNKLARIRSVGKVEALNLRVQESGLRGQTGIAHTRWATHGAAEERNAHPHVCNESVAVVHNGIIENHAKLREEQAKRGYRFTSDTDTEVIVHAVHEAISGGKNLLQAVRQATEQLEGAYALGVVSDQQPGRLVAARQGSPLVIGLGIGEYFIASDVAALLPVTNRFVFLEEGDVADLSRENIRIYDRQGKEVQREVKLSSLTADSVGRGEYRHYMLKEIYEQPRAIAETLEGRLAEERVLEASFGHNAAQIFDRVKAVQILACGTSYHAGMVARNWFEGLAGIPCQVEVASEYRYRHPVVADDTLVVVISQSGETADTLAALRATQKRGILASLAICNAPESSLMREADLNFADACGP